MRVKVLNVETQSEVREFSLEDLTARMGECLIGRSPDLGLVLESPDVSRLHGKFVNEDSQYVYYDLGSANGSLVNGKLAIANQPYPLKSNDIVRIGEFTLILREVQPLPQDLPMTVMGGADATIVESAMMNSWQLAGQFPGLSTQPSEESVPEIAEATPELSPPVPGEASIDSASAVEDGLSAIAEPDEIETAPSMQSTPLAESIEAADQDLPDAPAESLATSETAAADAADEPIDIVDVRDDVADIDVADIRDNAADVQLTDVQLTDLPLSDAYAVDSEPVNAEAPVAEVPAAIGIADEATATQTVIQTVDLETDLLEENSEATIELPAESSDFAIEPVDESAATEGNEVPAAIAPQPLQPLSDRYIALLCHDSQLAEMTQFVERHSIFLSRCLTVSTPSLSQSLTTVGLPVSQQMPIVPASGSQTMNSLITSNQVLAVIFLRDFFTPQLTQANDEALTRSCNVHQVFLANNLPTAEAIVYYLENLLTNAATEKALTESETPQAARQAERDQNWKNEI